MHITTKSRAKTSLTKVSLFFFHFLCVTTVLWTQVRAANMTGHIAAYAHTALRMMSVCNSSLSDIMFIHFYLFIFLTFNMLRKCTTARRLFDADNWTKMSF